MVHTDSTVVDKDVPLPPPPLPAHPPSNIDVLSQIKYTVHNESPVEALNNVLKSWQRLTNKIAPPKVVQYTHMNSVIQVGPTCGLVVLCMISSLTSQCYTLHDILNFVQCCQFSSKGEMFSSINFFEVAQSLLGNSFKIAHLTGGLSKHKESILENLKRGDVYAVPYDADKNHSPAMLMGHKSHWAVLCGIIEDDMDYYILARQGKSKYVGLWTFSSLEKSNSNLIEIDPESKTSGLIVCDIKENLAGSAIHFHAL